MEGTDAGDLQQGINVVKTSDQSSPIFLFVKPHTKALYTDKVLCCPRSVSDRYIGSHIAPDSIWLQGRLSPKETLIKLGWEEIFGRGCVKTIFYNFLW